MQVETSSTVVTTHALPFRLMNEIELVTDTIQHITKNTHEEFPQLLAYNFTQLAYHPKGYTQPPFLIRPGKIGKEGQDVDSVIIDYWVDGDPQSASGIMHRESLAMFKDAEGVHMYAYSHPHDPKATVHVLTSSEKKFEKKVDRLWQAMGKAVSLATQQLPNIYADQRYDFNQILASHEILKNITTIIQGDQQRPTQAVPTVLRRNWPFAARAPHRDSLHARNRAA